MKIGIYIIKFSMSKYESVKCIGIQKCHFLITVIDLPHPGQWDPLMWWMQHAHQQAFYPFMLPGCARAVPYATSAPVSSPGVNQRGFIKPPAGLPHQHCQMWEMQVLESRPRFQGNM